MKPKQLFSALGYSINTCFSVSPVRYLAVILLNFAVYAAPFAVTAIWKVALDQLSASATGRIALLIGAYIGVTAAANCAESVKIYLEHIVEEKVQIKADECFIEHASLVGMEYFDDPEKTDRLSLVGRRTRQVFFLQQYCWDVVLCAASIVSAIVLVAQNIPWALILIFAAYIPKIIIDTKRQKEAYENYNDTESERRKQEYYVQTVTEKQFAADVRLYGLVGMLLNRYRASYQMIKKLLDKQYRREATGAAIAMLFGWLGIGGVLIITIIAAVHGKITIGDVQYDFGLATLLAEKIEYVSVSLAFITAKVMAVSAHIAFIGGKQDVTEKLIYNKNDDLTIEFKDVTFRYPTSDRDVLSNVSFTIGSNERVALVGINGAGKTTIVKLLLGLYQPTGGNIYVNGIDINRYDPDSLHEIVSVMFQNHQEYAFSVADNITMFSEQNDARLEDAMKESGISGMVESWEQGADTCITRRFDAQGKELSGGQAQKLALARSLYRNDAKLFIMDEPSASLDAEAEDELFRSLLQISKNASAVFITHRMSMCSSADRVILIEDGHVLENGTHAELLSAQGRYSYLYNLQANQYADGLTSGGNANE